MEGAYAEGSPAKSRWKSSALAHEKTRVEDREGQDFSRANQPKGNGTWLQLQESQSIEYQTMGAAQPSKPSHAVPTPFDDYHPYVGY
jgi:hypothetical protein